MNLVDEADLLALMEEEDADAYTAEKEAAAQAEQDRLRAEEEAKKAAEEAAASGEEQPKENKVTKIASGFLGAVVLIALAAGGVFYAFAKQKQKKQAEKEALDPDANYTEDKGDFEIPVEDEPEENDEEDTEPILPPTYCNSKQNGGILIAKLIVAEKPSVAMSYAKVLGATNRKDGYLEGNGYLVSWCVGHLVELAPPNVYDAKYVKWSIADLPILPQKWQYLVSASTKKQFGILQKLMHRPDVDSVICATDAG